jgi:hypothetical protein
MNSAVLNYGYMLHGLPWAVGTQLMKNFPVKESEVHCRVHKNLPLRDILSLFYTVHIFIT